MFSVVPKGSGGGVQVFNTSARAILRHTERPRLFGRGFRHRGCFFFLFCLRLSPVRVESLLNLWCWYRFYRYCPGVGVGAYACAWNCCVYGSSVHAYAFVTMLTGAPYVALSGGRGTCMRVCRGFPAADVMIFQVSILQKHISVWHNCLTVRHGRRLLECKSCSLCTVTNVSWPRCQAGDRVVR